MLLLFSEISHAYRSPHAFQTAQLKHRPGRQTWERAPDFFKNTALDLPDVVAARQGSLAGQLELACMLKEEGNSLYKQVGVPRLSDTHIYAPFPPATHSPLHQSIHAPRRTPPAPPSIHQCPPPSPPPPPSPSLCAPPPPPAHPSIHPCPPPPPTICALLPPLFHAPPQATRSPLHLSMIHPPAYHPPACPSIIHPTLLCVRVAHRTMPR